MRGWVFRRITYRKRPHMSEPTQESSGTVPELAEGYPTLTELLRKLNNEENVRDVGVRRLDLNLFASGEATYNVWYVDAEEPEGGYIPPDDLA
jgi:hypothetical protein